MKRARLRRSPVEKSGGKEKKGEATPDPLTALRKDKPAEAGEPKCLKRGGVAQSGNREGEPTRCQQEMRGERA